MALHEVQLKGYSVRPGNLSLGTFDSYGIEQLHVTADDSWDGLDILAVFHAPNGDAKKVVVGADGMLNVPPEATAKQAGNGRIVFVGLAENVQRITVDMGYNTKTHSDIEGDNPGVPTPDVVQQILQAALNAEQNSAEAKRVANGLRDDAANGKFDGKDGAKGDKGDNGIAPQLKIGEDNLWNVSYNNGATWVSLGVKATGDVGKDGADGVTPHIGENGNWWLGNTDTGVSAKGPKGDPGQQGPAGEIPEDYPQIREDVSQLKEDLSNIISPNLFNPAVAKENAAISPDDGSEMDGFSGWETTDYIPVSKNDVLYFSANNEPTPYSTGAFYDAQKKFVSGFGNPNDDNNITVTSDGYAKFSFNSKKEKLQIEKGSRTTYVPYGEVKIRADVDNVKEDTDNIKAEVSEVKAEVVKIQEDHSNLFNKDAVVKGAVLPDSGYFDTSFSSWETSDYIPVKPGMVLYFSSNELPIGVASTGAYFDKDKKYLSPLKDEPLSITIPDGAYFIRFSKNGGFGDTLNTLKIEQHGITKFTSYGELYVTVNESALPSSILPKWKGLKILTLGDSITAMGGVNGWTYWIKQYLLADKVVNVSVAGSTWQDKVANQTYDGNPQPSTDGNVMGNQVQKVLNAKANGDADYQDFDVITFSFGTNDSVDFSVQTKESVESQFITNYAQNNFTVVPIDSVNRQTLAGAMRYGFQKLHETYPNAVIFMCTPTQECYESFDSIYQKGDFINFVADRCGAETIDTRRCGIRNFYESQTTIDYDHPEQSGVAPIQTDLLDGIHTNENGAKKIAKYNAREIMKYFMLN